MSYEAQAWARKIKVGSPATKAVLLQMANCADQEGFCFPSVQYLEQATEFSRRAVQRAIQALEGMGLIVKTPRLRSNGSCTSNEYQMLLSVTDPVAIARESSRPAGSATTEKASEIDGGGVMVTPQGGCHGDTGGGVMVTPPESSVESSLKDSSSEILQTPEVGLDADDLKIAQWMHASIRRLYPKAKPPNWRRWCNDIRLMQTRDKHSRHDICALFRWANSDPFWSANVLSPGTLRAKWMALYLKANAQARDAGQRGPALVSAGTVCRCGKAGIFSPGGGVWLCAQHRDEHKAGAS